MNQTPVPPDRISQKRAVKLRIWGVFALVMALVAVGALLVIPFSALQVSTVNALMTSILCFVPVLVLLLPLWLGLAAAMFGVARLETTVTRQLASAESSAHDAKIRARTAGRALGRAVIRLRTPLAAAEAWLATLTRRDDNIKPPEETV
ncbi:MAG: hypothetical protein MUF38_06780 [Anaerolineae bacterium]|jgi:hypothetical protein|nr:hypothetical protein [Anaerolineae bacterium]